MMGFFKAEQDISWFKNQTYALDIYWTTGTLEGTKITTELFKRMIYL